MQRLEQGFLSKARDMDFFAEFDTAKSLVGAGRSRPYFVGSI